MLINKIVRNSIVLLFLLVQINAKAQTVFESHHSEVYPYLYRMAQKGLINFQDIIRPISRMQISNALDSLHSKQAQLSKIEKDELAFYLQEFRPIEGGDDDKFQFMKKDPNQRPRLLFINNKNFQLNADPFVSFMQVSGSGKQFRRIGNGINFWGQSKRFAFQFSYRDFAEQGRGMDTFRSESPETGIILLNNTGVNSRTFNVIKTNISYTWKNGNISVGNNHLLWGYGENGRIVLSDRAPIQPYIRFDYSPFKWLQFNYAHTWLNSNIVDSNASYRYNGGGAAGDFRVQFIPKYMATHSLIFTPLKGLDIAVGESIVYSDKMDIGFLIPINFFKIYDNNRSVYNINAGSNGQFFGQISSRNHIKNTHLYGSIFIDEIRISSIFNSQKSRNQLGYTLGASVTDAFVHYLTLGGEYTRVNKFVYNNLLPAQNYTQFDYPLGDWMGNNFDRLTLFAKYTPIPRLRTYLRMQHIRKGGPGTVFDQYNAEPQPRFLSDFQKTRTDYFFQVSYEWINNLYFTGSYQFLKQTLANGAKANNTTIQIGMSYGLR